MKVDKSNARHWLYLALFGLNSLIAVVVRPFRSTSRKNTRTLQIILYGHRLSGNLLALHRHIHKYHGDDFRLTFLTMDPKYHQRLCHDDIRSCLATRPSAIRLLCAADAVISDHGLHSMVPLLWLSDVKFFDVWHGIPFKGFEESDFKSLHCYTETWVPSPLLAKLYEERFGFPRKNICVTGYARTDSLVIPEETDDQIRQRLRLQHVCGKKLVLFAPTWKQDATDRTLFPFGIEPEIFLRELSRLCQRHDAILAVRIHINARLTENVTSKDIEFLPFDKYPDTEAILQITGILICDWSSIAFDFLLLDRPTIFLDVPVPFAKGFTITPDFRYGEIASTLPHLMTALETSLTSEDIYWNHNKERHHTIKSRLYGDNAHGNSTRNCVERLRLHLPK